MADRNIHVATTKGGEHIQHIVPTNEDRKKYAKEFREEKNHQQKIKEERFAAIDERRKKNPSGPGAEGKGINIEVTGD